MEHTLQLICDNPKRWRNEYRHYRELGLKKYPYVIIYFIEEDIQQVIKNTSFIYKRVNGKQIVPRVISNRMKENENYICEQILSTHLPCGYILIYIIDDWQHFQNYWMADKNYNTTMQHIKSLHPIL